LSSLHPLNKNSLRQFRGGSLPWRWPPHLRPLPRRGEEEESNSGDAIRNSGPYRGFPWWCHERASLAAEDVRTPALESTSVLIRPLTSILSRVGERKRRAIPVTQYSIRHDAEDRQRGCHARALCRQ
jgi:hypothetical protein